MSAQTQLLPPDRRVPAERLDEIESFLVGEVSGLAGSVSSSAGVRRFSISTVVAALVFLSSTVGAAAYIFTRPATELGSIGCYEEASLTAGTAAITGTTGENPESICAELWQQGEITGYATEPPTLTACVLDTGAVGVFPGDQSVCSEMGLAGLTDGFEEASGNRSALNEALVSRLDVGRCYTAQEYGALLREEMDRHGLSDWTIQIGEFPAGLPCAQLRFDDERQTAEIFGAPPIAEMGGEAESGLDPPGPAAGGPSNPSGQGRQPSPDPATAGAQ